MRTTKYKMTELGPIPVEWEVKRLGEIGTPLMCKRVLKSQTADSGEIPFYKIGTFGQKADAFISRDLYETFKRLYSCPKKGEVLLSAAGTIGRCVIFDGTPSYFQDSNIVWLENDERIVCNEFLYWLYQVTQWQTENGGSVSRLYNDILCETKVVVPPLPEQRRIAEALSDAAEWIESLDKLIEKKKLVKQGAMQALLSGKTRLPGFSGEWEERRLGEIGFLLRENINPQASPTQDFFEYSMPNYDTGQHPQVVRGSQMHSARIPIHAPVVLFNKLNVRQKRIWLVENCPDHSVCSSEFLPFYSETIDCKFLAYYLATEQSTSDFIECSTGTSNSQKRITPRDFLDYLVSVPPTLAEQRAIAAVLSDMDAELAALSREKAKAEQIKQGMMQELLTGRVRLGEGE